MTPTKVAAPVVDESTKENNDAPPKVDDTTTTTTNNNAKGPASAVEFEPPLACVRRILKNSLPSSTNVGKDASAAFARASGIFIIYLTACANDFARENRRQTITANDVLAAIKELEFDEFTPQLTQFLELYRENEKSKKEAKAKKKVAKGSNKEVANTPQSANSKGDESGDVSMDNNEDDNSDDGDRDEEDLPVEEDVEDMDE